MPYRCEKNGHLLVPGRSACPIDGSPLVWDPQRSPSDPKPSWFEYACNFDLFLIAGVEKVQHWLAFHRDFKHRAANYIWYALWILASPVLIPLHIFLFFVWGIFSPGFPGGDNRLNDPLWVLPPSAYERAGYWPTRANRGTDSDGSGMS